MIEEPQLHVIKHLSFKREKEREREREREKEKMELSQHGFLEELLSLRRDTWNTFPTGLNELFPSGSSSFDCFDESSSLNLASASNIPSSLAGFSSATEPSFNIECPFNELEAYPFVETFTVPSAHDQFHSSYNNNDTALPFPLKDQDYPSVVEDEDQLNLLTINDIQSSEEMKSVCKVEMEHQSSQIPVFNNMGDGALCGERKQNRVKKVEGQPSKNLMAERRRRKRLNDRLSMLRSIVPKISKMDRTSILGDTIDYMKELLERIDKLKEEEIEEVGTDNQMGLLKELKPNEVVARNSPKFDVERRNINTRIEICCSPKPGLLLSTVNTIEALGLEIQECVISCFNDFSLQASCSEVEEQRDIISSEDIKQALFRNAGYGGRCV
nr:basic helix-loop-helix transcription factor [Loropetalum chinense var. rubrum]